MRGSLFTRDFLEVGVTEQPEWLALSDFEIEAFADRAREVYRAFPVAGDPFVWDEDDRRRRRAILDELFFHLYGIEGGDDVRYILSTFPIVKREDEKQFGRYVTEDLILGYMRALAAGDPDADFPVPPRKS